MKNGLPLLVLAILVHFLSFLLMLRQVEPFYSYFYLFAWWSYILAVAVLNHRLARASLLFDRPREFLAVFLFSTPVWLVFEAFNFRLQNWHYLDSPAEIYLRWPGYVLAFGTVLPAIFETQTLLYQVGCCRNLRGPSLGVQALIWRLPVLGLLMLVVSLFSPHLFFPLVWIGFIFLLDPLVYRLGAREESIFGLLSQGSYGLPCRLLLAGLWCGFLWEFWNYWAGSKWVYTIPFFDAWRLFEMPALGYLGFPPFALECYLFYRAGVRIHEHFLASRPLLRYLTYLLLALLCLSVFEGIDRLTTLRFRVTF